MYHYGLIQQDPDGILVLDKRGTAGGCASDIEMHRESGRNGVCLRSMPLRAGGGGQALPVPGLREAEPHPHRHGGGEPGVPGPEAGGCLARCGVRPGWLKTKKAAPETTLFG